MQIVQYMRLAPLFPSLAPPIHMAAYFVDDRCGSIFLLFIPSARSAARLGDVADIDTGTSLGSVASSACYDSTGRFDDRKMAQGGGTGT